MRRFYVPPEQIGTDTIELNREESHHLTKVLRLSRGDEVLVFDGRGREYRGRVSTVEKSAVRIAVDTEVQPAAPESPLSITLCSTVLPGEKYDLVVQKAVELGVVRIVPLITARCEVRSKDAAKRLERWRRIAMEATKQCGRATLMAVAEPVEFPAVIGCADAARTIMFSERDGTSLTASFAGDELTVLIGPKGGWEDAELERAREAGVALVTLGGRILRAETAAIALTALLQHRFGDFN
jgi:16S rRNA (uracil1498-N3)-methyltransferase